MDKLPQEFTDYTSKLFGLEGWQKFLSAFDAPTPVSIRFNPFKETRIQEWQEDKTIVPIPWCRNGYWLSERPDFTLDPLLHAGCYYVQEAGSMFLDHVLRHIYGKPTQRDNISTCSLPWEGLGEALVLDLCAAPGGKSTLLRSFLPDSAWLISNEPDRRRANILMENMQKQGHPRVTVTNGYAKDFRKAKMHFPLIVADVPCSGEGMFRKDEGAVKEWSMQNVTRCAELQRSIIEDIWPCLEPGGILVYSTCTFNTHEDEENVRWICDGLGASLIDIPTLPEWNIQGSLLEGFEGPVYRFIPGITRSEGLFMAVLRKEGDKKTRSSRIQDYSFHPSLRILHHGVPSGTQKGKDFIPDHALALSADVPSLHGGLGRVSYPRQELSLDDALRYLHREVIVLPPDTPRGYVIVTYQGHALGFVKNIGTRANNLYPKEWAIRKSVH